MGCEDRPDSSLHSGGYKFTRHALHQTLKRLKAVNDRHLFVRPTDFASDTENVGEDNAVMLLDHVKRKAEKEGAKQPKPPERAGREERDGDKRRREGDRQGTGTAKRARTA